MRGVWGFRGWVSLNSFVWDHGRVRTQEWEVSKNLKLELPSKQFKWGFCIIICGLLENAVTPPVRVREEGNWNVWITTSHFHFHFLYLIWIYSSKFTFDFNAILHTFWRGQETNSCLWDQGKGLEEGLAVISKPRNEGYCLGAGRKYH